MHDIFEQRRDRLDELTAAISPRASQIGALVALGGRFTVLDHVSRPEVFSSLLGPLVQGYALDALEARDGSAPSIDGAASLLTLLGDVATSRNPSVGLGDEASFAAPVGEGAGLVVEGELLQLNAFFGSGPAPGIAPNPVERTRIRRPSRRRTR